MGNIVSCKDCGRNICGADYQAVLDSKLRHENKTGHEMIFEKP